jgi:hypothetical protein
VHGTRTLEPLNETSPVDFGVGGKKYVQMSLDQPNLEDARSLVERDYSKQAAEHGRDRRGYERPAILSCPDQMVVEPMAHASK